jgi:hypothetical protein
VTAVCAGLVTLTLVLYVQQPPSGTPLWSVPPRLAIDVYAAWPDTLERWSPMAEVAATASDDSAVLLDGGAYLPMTTHEFVTQVAEQHVTDVAVLDAMEASLHIGLEALVIVACAALDVSPCDAGFFRLNAELAHA